MGRLDLLDVYRDEDYTWRYDSSVDSPLMVREAGDSIALRTTEESDMGCEFELRIPETHQVVRAGFVDRQEAEEAAIAYREDVGVEVVVVENWRG